MKDKKFIQSLIKKKKSNKIHNGWVGIIYAKDWFAMITMITIRPEDLVIICWHEIHDGVNSHIENKTTIAICKNIEDAILIYDNHN
jgi:hypothetical protein